MVVVAECFVFIKAHVNVRSLSRGVERAGVVKYDAAGWTQTIKAASNIRVTH